ncbi:MAG: GFA family protein [Novosphingobium sp.]
MTYAGRCACATVTLEIADEPIATRQCWCRQCQQIAAGGPTNNAMFKTEAVTISGDLGWHEYVAASGNTLRQGFCRSCGSPVVAWSSARPYLRTVRLGVLDPGHGLGPAMAIWTGEAPPWAVIDPALERHAGQPPAPPKPS